MDLIAAIHKEYNQESSSDYQDNTVALVLKEIPFKEFLKEIPFDCWLVLIQKNKIK